MSKSKSKTGDKAADEAVSTPVPKQVPKLAVARRKKLLLVNAVESYTQHLDDLLVTIHSPGKIYKPQECIELGKGPTEVRVDKMIKALEGHDSLLFTRNVLTTTEWRKVLAAVTPSVFIIITDPLSNFPSEALSRTRDVHIFRYPNYEWLRRNATK